MAFFTVNCFSEALHMSVSLNVVMPQKLTIDNPVNGGHATPPYPLLYLLHGYNGDHTVWARRTSVERYATERGIAVVMPAAHNSFYTDMDGGFAYWTYIAEELPAICRDLFPQVTADPDRTFAAGLSMGGYGAFKLGLAHPERFRGVASLSGALDVAALAERLREEDGTSQFTRIYGDRAIRGSENDLFALTDRAVREGKTLPAMYQWCGRQDFLYEDNLRLKEYLLAAGADLTYEEGDGDHQWKYWDSGIERVLDWMQTLE